MRRHSLPETCTVTQFALQRMTLVVGSSYLGTSVAPGHVVLSGDFNLPDVSWRNHGPVIDNLPSLHATFSDIINYFDLSQFVTEPTRAGISSSNVLGILLCNTFPSITSVSVVPGTSDP